MEKNRRNTKTKQLVINVLEQSKSALSHEDIEQKMPEKMDRVTIYRILNGFCDDGKVHKIVGEDGKTYYSLCHHCTTEQHNDNHAHFRCTECQTITCLDEQPLAQQTVPNGYNVSSISTFLTGICPRCVKIISIICLFLSVFGLSAQTQPADTISDWEVIPISDFIIHNLQEIKVSGYSSRLQGENVANVEKLSLRETPFLGTSLSEKLTWIAGIDNYSTGTGIGKPVIRGLSGNRIAVFSQGVRIENQQWGDEHGLGLDDNGYEQVEIIKGPASLLYGSDALGGVLFFADERYAANNNIEAAINSEFHSNSTGFRNNAAFKLSKDKFHLNLFGGYTTHTDYFDGYNQRTPNSRFNTNDFKTTLAYTGNTFVTSLKYNRLNEKYGLTEVEEDHEEMILNGRTPQLPYQNLNTHLLAWENTVFFANHSKLKFDVGYIFNQRQEFEDEHHHDEGEPDEDEDPGESGEEAALDMNLSTLSYSAKWYSPRWNRWELIAGSQGLFQTNKNHGEEQLIPDASTLDVGAFAMTNFYYGEKAYWQSGIRFDNRNIQTSDNILNNNYFAFNFSTGIFQPLTENFSLRVNLSSGFRSPNMFELLSDGIHHGANRYEIGNAELKTENSYQADATLNYKTLHFEAFISPYFNYIRHFIYLQPAAESIDETPVYNYSQTDAFLYGGETGIHLHPHPWDWLHIECSYANTLGRDIDKNYLPLMPSQKLKANVSAVFTPEKVLKKYSFYLQNLYSFAQNLVAREETATPSYNVLNGGVLLEFQFGKQRLLLNLSANNLLNERYFDHLSRYKTEGIYNQGRNFVAKISLPVSAGF
ncbi:MAG: TonB-dependent receptor [Dysgonamonadaceae bacterium]|jgi:iron complex outermembrane receptor protein|nr:TonB-dependent receptor [Dysgonamonadaceae bacterium]